jgi:cbb3-type cytochrome oxidase subunit 3
MHHMLESQTHLLVGMALVFYCYASFAWRKKQAVETAGWLSGELSPPKQ